ncbi:hypothetical protein AK812_SmicGene46660 [Symbiodinium microadriaticum]|uniref:Uncharacterized protein n=1 Tax=Symbiodinium microadriaticum TaxID=2951 RepID=A0A1Q9BTF1_SYMMI|nr:hypothetical protein AK812_SmicGene46660 [Symbiodinium microadriaticum]
MLAPNPRLNVAGGSGASSSSLWMRLSHLARDPTPEVPQGIESRVLTTNDGDDHASPRRHDDEHDDEAGDMMT